MNSQPRFLIQFLDDESVVYDRLGGDSHYLDPLATAIYSLHQASSDLSITQLADRLSRPADDGFKREISSTVERLRQLGLITEEGHAGK